MICAATWQGCLSVPGRSTRWAGPPGGCAPAGCGRPLGGLRDGRRRRLRGRDLGRTASARLAQGRAEQAQKAEETRRVAAEAAREHEAKQRRLYQGLVAVHQGSNSDDKDGESATMGAQAPASCPNCQRLQEQLDDLRDATGDPPRHLRSLAGVTRRRARILRPPPSPRPPTSSSRPSRHHPRARTNAERADNPDTPSTNAHAFLPEALNGGSFDHRLDTCPACGQDLYPALTIAPRVVPQVDIREVPLSIQEHRGHSGCRVRRVCSIPLEILSLEFVRRQGRRLGGERLAAPAASLGELVEQE